MLSYNPLAGFGRKTPGRYDAMREMKDPEGPGEIAPANGIITTVLLVVSPASPSVSTASYWTFSTRTGQG